MAIRTKPTKTPAEPKPNKPSASADIQFAIGPVLKTLETTYHDHPMGTLTEGQPYKVLMACILSLRTKDEVSIPASERLFAVADTPQAMAKLAPETIEKLIFPTGFYKTKAKTLIDVSQKLLDDFNGEVPKTIDELLTLKGVGRKTANLVVGLGHLLPAVCVDTHVFRICNRLGYLVSDSPEVTEMLLREHLPVEYWSIVNWVLVRHGQETCKPIGPRCDVCTVSQWCQKVDVKPRTVSGKVPGKPSGK